MFPFETTSLFYLLLAFPAVTEGKAYGDATIKQWKPGGGHGDKGGSLRSANTALSNKESVSDQERSLVVGGQPAVDGRYPYFALVVSANFPFFSCGGTLIHDDFVLTAAHCLGLAMDADWSVPSDIASKAANLLVFVDPDEHPSEANVDEGISVVDIVVHPDYDEAVSAVDNDLVLLQLGELVDRQSRQLILNRETSSPASGQEVKVIGFGATDTSGSEFPAFLQEAALDIVGTELCEAVYTTIHEADRDICASSGDSAVPRDACFGDSGGPLLVPGDGATVSDIQVGIVSHGPEAIAGLDVPNPCADPSFPGVYVRVSAYVDWIDETICTLSQNKPSSCNEDAIFENSSNAQTNFTDTNDGTNCDGSGC